MIAMPSLPTDVEMASPPLDLTAADSEASMARDESAKSTVPLISAAMPVPEPPPLTAMLTPGLSVMNCSDHACARLIIVSEPAIVSEPDSGALAGAVDVLAAGVVVPQPVRASAPATMATTAASANHFVPFTSPSPHVDERTRPHTDRREASYVL